MDSNAAGQLLGYTLQYPRALYQLLCCGPGDAVSVEVIGDVSTSTSTDQTISEEVKSSINANPLGNKSINLWKTFYNWIKAIKSTEIELTKTKFVLYCNKDGKDKSIIKEFNSVLNKNESVLAVNNAIKLLKGIDSNHEIWKFYDFVINKNKKILIDLLPRFEVIFGSDTSRAEVEKEIQKKLVPENFIDYIFEMLTGWLQNFIIEKISNKKPAIIYWEDFNEKFKTLFTEVRSLKLIDFAFLNPVKEDEIHSYVSKRPMYIQQLEAIGMQGSDFVTAVTDYLRAKVNRAKWIEEEIITKETGFDFEKRLTDFWETQYRKYVLTEKNRTPEEIGILIYSECKSRLELIKEQTPPRGTIAGTYHELSNVLTLGWHPNWKNNFTTKKKSKVVGNN